MSSNRTWAFIGILALTSLGLIYFKSQQTSQQTKSNVAKEDWKNDKMINLVLKASKENQCTDESSVLRADNDDRENISTHEIKEQIKDDIFFNMKEGTSKLEINGLFSEELKKQDENFETNNTWYKFKKNINYYQISGENLVEGKCLSREEELKHETRNKLKNDESSVSRADNDDIENISTHEIKNIIAIKKDKMICEELEGKCPSREEELKHETRNKLNNDNY